MRVLLVTPALTFLPSAWGSQGMVAGRAGARADLTLTLAIGLHDLGAEVHVALPHFRRMFDSDVAGLIADEVGLAEGAPGGPRIHRAEDRLFYFRDEPLEADGDTDLRLALAFQREVINTILPRVKPDLVHCNDWMTALVPAAARARNIRSLFTLHNMQTARITLAGIEDAGIQTREFWQNFYFERMPAGYDETRADNPVDVLASGVFAADAVNTVSPTFLDELVRGCQDFVPANVRAEVARKKNAGAAAGITAMQDAGYAPDSDPRIACRYSADTLVEGKAANKAYLQKRMGLDSNPAAPLFFWPYRLDAGCRGCDLLAHILPEIIATYAADGLQVAIVADGLYQKPFRDIIRHHRLERRVALSDAADDLWRQGYAASDFVLAPGLFEPCGRLVQIGLAYGSLPVARDTGALHDIVTRLDTAGGAGNGFLFETYDAAGLKWAIGEAMAFRRLAADAREAHVKRIMRASVRAFAPPVAAGRYMELYRAILAAGS